MKVAPAGNPLHARSTRARILLSLVVMLAYGLFAAVKAHDSPGGVTAFIVAGDRWFDRAALDTPVAVLTHSDGYDGQFVYRLALDPFTTQRTAHGITIDTPSLRAQRIGYPLLAHFLSFGRASAVPLVLVAINLASLGLLSWISTGIATVFGRPAWHGMIVPLYPGLLLSFARDTTEIMSAALALTAVYLALKGRWWAAGLVACAAVLTRETTLLYLAGFGVVALLTSLRERRGDWRVAAFCLPVIALVGWQLVLVRVWGRSSLIGLGQEDFGLVPLRYFVAAVVNDVHGILDHGHVHYIHQLVTKMFLVACGIVFCRAAFATRPIDWRITLPWLLYSALALLFSGSIWAEPFGYLRVLADLYIMGCLVVLRGPIGHQPRTIMRLAVPVCALGLIVA